MLRLQLGNKLAGTIEELASILNETADLNSDGLPVINIVLAEGVDNPDTKLPWEGRVDLFKTLGLHGMRITGRRKNTLILSIMPGREHRNA